MTDKVNPDILFCFFMSVIPEFFRKLTSKIEDPTPMTQKKKIFAGVLLFAVEKISSRFRNSCLAGILQRPLFDLQRLIHKVTVDRPGKIEPFMFG